MTDDENKVSEFDTPPEDNFEDDPFADFESGGGKNSISALLGGNPLVKVGVVLGGFILIVGGVMLFGGKKEAPIISTVSQGNMDTKQTPGTAELPESYRQALEDSNVADAEKAIQTGESSIPVPTTPPVGSLESLGSNDTTAEDPLERWRRIQEERQRQEVPATPIEPVAEVDYTEQVAAMGEQMATQMQSILESNKIVAPKAMNVSAPDYIRAKKEAELAKQQEAYQAALNTQAAYAQQGTNAYAPQVTQEIMVPAGKIEYGQLLIEANSDIQGPVLAMIASGPLTGARLLGAFSVEKEYLVLTFNTVVIDGVSTPVNAIALDPKTTLPGMATDVDHRYFTRIILPAAGAFIEGFGSAVADSGSTTVTVDGGAAVESDLDKDTEEELYSAVADAAERISEELDEQSDDTEILVRVAAGTPMGILFLQPVIKPPETEQTSQANQ